MKRIEVQPDLRGYILIVIAVAGMSGILLDSWLLLSQYVLLIGATIALACVISFWRESRWMLVSLAILWLLLGSSWHDAHGQIEVQIPGASIDNPYGPNYGDNVEIQGKVQPPFPHHSPEVVASMTFPRLTIVGSAGNPLIAAFLHLRLWLASLITQLLPQPMAALLIAILLSLQTPVNSGFAM